MRALIVTVVTRSVLAIFALPTHASYAPVGKREVGKCMTASLVTASSIVIGRE
jgi:hypothetical protein